MMPDTEVLLKAGFQQEMWAGERQAWAKWTEGGTRFYLLQNEDGRWRCLGFEGLTGKMKRGKPTTFEKAMAEYVGWLLTGEFEL